MNNLFLSTLCQLSEFIYRLTKKINQAGPNVIKTFFMHNSCWHFNIYQPDK